MAEKMIGYHCNDCETGKYVKNPKTGKIFCDKKCWLSDVPSKVENSTERNFDPLQEDLQRRVAELELWRANMKPYLEKLVDEIKSLRILVEEVAGKKATDLHTSLKNRDIREVKETLKGGAALVDSYKSDPSIPVVELDDTGFPKV